MSVWLSAASSQPPLLHGVEGDLLSVRVTVEAFLLEDLLDALAEAPFPINPEIQHHAGIERDGEIVPAVHVEFPVWRQRLAELERLIEARGLGARISVGNMLEEIRQ